MSAQPAAHGGSRLVAAVALAGVVLAGCGGSDDADRPRPASTSTSAAERSPTAIAPTASTPAATLSASASPPMGPGELAATPVPTIGDTGPGPRGVVITRPPPGVPATGPAVVLVHGGFWIGGEPSDLDEWAQAMAAAGSVVFNASYRLVGQPGGGYPGSVDDIVCAVRYARAQAPALTSSDELVVMGHSAGGHLAAVAALNGDAFAAGCPYPAAELPDRLVGLAGVYDVRTVAFVFGGFVGAPPALAPAAWASVNPIELGDRRDDLAVTLLAGADDRLVPPPGAQAFAAVLPADSVTVEVVPGADHVDLMDPAVVGLDRIGLGG